MAGVHTLQPPTVSLPPERDRLASELTAADLQPFNPVADPAFVRLDAPVRLVDSQPI